MITNVIKNVKDKHSLLEVKPHHKLDEFHFGVLHGAGLIEEINITEGNITSVHIDLHKLINRIVYQIV